MENFKEVIFNKSNTDNSYINERFMIEKNKQDRKDPNPIEFGDKSFYIFYYNIPGQSYCFHLFPENTGEDPLFQSAIFTVKKSSDIHKNVQEKKSWGYITPSHPVIVKFLYCDDIEPISAKYYVNVEFAPNLSYVTPEKFLCFKSCTLFIILQTFAHFLVEYQTVAYSVNKWDKIRLFNPIIERWFDQYFVDPTSLQIDDFLAALISVDVSETDHIATLSNLMKESPKDWKNAGKVLMLFFDKSNLNLTNDKDNDDYFIVNINNSEKTNGKDSFEEISFPINMKYDIKIKIPKVLVKKRDFHHKAIIIKDDPNINIKFNINDLFSGEKDITKENHLLYYLKEYKYIFTLESNVYKFPSQFNFQCAFDSSLIICSNEELIVQPTRFDEMIIKISYSDDKSYFKFIGDDIIIELDFEKQKGTDKLISCFRMLFIIEKSTHMGIYVPKGLPLCVECEDNKLCLKSKVKKWINNENIMISEFQSKQEVDGITTNKNHFEKCKCGSIIYTNIRKGTKKKTKKKTNKKTKQTK